MEPSKKYICIHGHFYQPPRENAWLEVVELQDSAAPFHDWNERINYECYAPNTAARILDGEGYITEIVNNYARISFNFGPTLLQWVEKADPETYQAILKADKLSQERYGGHGSALAQVHGHLIMPLADRRDKITQIEWGIKDFRHRFGRHPEGIWLAETAVDTETLELLAERDVLFTILAPRQAKAYRSIGDSEWLETPDGSIDPRRPYLYNLPSGRSIVLFFYHGEISQEVAFKGLLNNGKHFAHRLLDGFDNDQQQLMHIATDGESYGHHHRKGEMALADCLDYLEDQQLATIMNYGHYLGLFPPDHEVQIHENSSWSCVHGVERWRSNCGCNSGGHPGWTQEWRKPLRDTLNWLRDELRPLYEKEAGKFLLDVWEARNDYIRVILNRHPDNVQAFIQRNARRLLNKEEKIKLLRLMEMQRNTMLMFTSCGWFFDEISGIETNQILQYANRAIYYADQVAGAELHNEFIQRLELAPSNVFENGAISYKKHVAPARVDLERVAMHYAVSSLFETYPEYLEFFNYIAESETLRLLEAGKQKFALGRTTVKSRITHSEKQFSFAALYLGQQNIIGNISLDLDRSKFDKMAELSIDAFQSTNLGEVIGLMQTYFGSDKYSIRHLFRDEKRKILRQITEQSLDQVEKSFREIYNDNYQLMMGMQRSNIPIPEGYQSAVKFIVNHDLYKYFSNGSTNHIRELKRLAEEFKKWNIDISNEQSLALAVSEYLFSQFKSMKQNGEMEKSLIDNLIVILETLQGMGVHPEVWKSQNLYFSLLKKFKNGELIIEEEETRKAFLRLGEMLKVRM